MAVLQSLEDVYGIRPSYLTQASPAIMRFLSQPREAYWGSVIYLDISTWKVQPVTPDLAFGPGLIIDIVQERNRVAEFLGLRHIQGELLLGPVVVGQ